ncbi:MAG TPA: PIN domain-containing protein [Burkholderiales bacterium]|nr:PIN domain-containing protein [Burkholderiales bacterium]
MKVFVDTNVLLYRFDRDSPKKQQVAKAELRRLILERAIVLSTQVLQEFYVAATRKLKQPLEPERAAAVVDYLVRLPLLQIGAVTVQRAIALHREHSISFWDALIVQTAIAAGADLLYSEDLQSGQQFEGVTVVDPFTAVQRRG